MTCLEQYKLEHPKEPLSAKYRIPFTCPHDEGYRERPDWCLGFGTESDCASCWNRESAKSTNDNSTNQKITLAPNSITIGGPTVIYRCDRRACPTCSYPECQYTADINHAISFHLNEKGWYVED